MGETDRIRVPTNGHRPGFEPDEGHAAADAAGSGPASELLPSEPDLRVAVTPGQLAAGFGILAGLILVVLGSRRRGRRRDGPD